ncbi:MAG: hypothetical protein IKI21_03190 [Oscillospiraceae bacterium]|nr:hypothetical protein [Oscillospiraceae bacterium]
MRKNVLIAAMILMASMAMTVSTGAGMTADPISASAASVSVTLDEDLTDEDPGPMGGVARRQQAAALRALALVGRGSIILNIDPVFEDDYEFVILVRSARGQMLVVLADYDGNVRYR